jgi:quinol monooxygenase YgiN
MGLQAAVTDGLKQPGCIRFELMLLKGHSYAIGKKVHK